MNRLLYFLLLENLSCFIVTVICDTNKTFVHPANFACLRLCSIDLMLPEILLKPSILFINYWILLLFFESGLDLLGINQQKNAFSVLTQWWCGKDDFNCVVFSK